MTKKPVQFTYDPKLIKTVENLRRERLGLPQNFKMIDDIPSKPKKFRRKKKTHERKIVKRYKK